MSARKRQRRVIDSDSEEELSIPAVGGLATVPAHLGRLRRAGHDTAAAGEEVIDLCDEGEPGTAARAPPPPQPGELVTPQPARQPEAPTTRRRSGLRDRVPSSKKAQRRAALAQLQRRRSGAGALEDIDEDEGGSQDGGSSGSASEGEGAEEGSEEAEELSSSSDDGFIVSDEDEQGEVARQQLRGMIGGRAMDEQGRMKLYIQTRLLRLLGALPHADSLNDEVKACLAAMLSFERNLRQFEVQSQNLEHWRHADPGLKARFEECEVLETEEGGYRWGKHCSFCRHDRHRKIATLTLRFRGRRQRVVLLEPILAKRGLLPGLGCGAADEHGTPAQPAVGGDGSEPEDASDASSGSGGSGSSSGSSSSSGDDDEPLSVSYARRQALRKQQERQAERAQRAQRRQQQQAGTPLRARQVARELAAAGDGCSSDEDSLLGGAGIARHAVQRRRLAGRKRQRVAIVSSDEEEEEQAEQQQQRQQRQQRQGGVEEIEEEDGPASSDGGSQQQQEEDEDGIAEQGGEEEGWAHGADPDASDSSASELGKRPRRCPRIGTDCWARAYVHRAIHRYPARLDAMLLYCTRRYLATTPEAEQPCTLAGLAHAVVQRYGHPLAKHYNQFMYSINSFNLLQNRRSDKSFANACIVNELKGLQYAHFTQLSPEEELWGVNIDAELAAFTAAAAERRQRRLDAAAAAAAAAGGDAAAAAEEGDDAEEDCGRLLLLRAAGGCGPGAADSEDEGQEADVHYAAEEEAEEPEEPGQRRRARQRRNQQEQERPEMPFLQRQRRLSTPQQGGQRAAAAIAAAAAEYGGQGGGSHAQQGAAGRATPQPGSEQRQQREEAARDRNACFYCGGAGHWAAECPERQRCFRCKQIGHWGRDCPLLQRGSCYKCKQLGHWAANCPNG